ncbi:MAG: PDZ domain-containing protein [Nitrospirales bacterium]|nr:PDZ domain-containing protein [Nitrospirales bacterium]
MPSIVELGMAVEKITPRPTTKLHLKDRAGVVVVNVSPGSPADFVGIRAGDVIEDEPYPGQHSKDYDAAMKKSGREKPVLFLLKRGGQTFSVTIEVS